MLATVNYLENTACRRLKHNQDVSIVTCMVTNDLSTFKGGRLEKNSRNTFSSLAKF